MWTRTYLTLLCSSLVGCAVSSDPGAVDPIRFPVDFEDRYLESKDCRLSHEHELRYIRVLVSPRAITAYETLAESEPFEPGDVLLKTEYDDAACTQLLGYTVLYREASGYAPERFDWRWQRVDAERRLLLDGPGGGAIETCVTCHQVHCSHSGGFELVCKDDSGGG